MEVKVAKSSGFCFGVQRAVDSVFELLDKGIKPIYTFGPIIHNEIVVADLEAKGVRIINDASEVDKESGGVVVIRSHGISRRTYDELKSTGLEIVDSTCPFVKKIHSIVEEESSKGKKIVIIGDKCHPEVQAIMGWCGSDVAVVSNEDDISAVDFPLDSKLCVVSQTTFNSKYFQYLVEILLKKGYDVNVVNTICNATNERQKEAEKISSEVDVMIVIGGKHSSNTRKLYEICSSVCPCTYFIQQAEDLKKWDLSSIKSIGITAGASTPKNIIEEVHTECQK